jgi:RNA 3'-terminal phosphate cyclase (ATP)
MDFLKIDGSYGEGGGQIVRSAITLSSITKKPIIIENIRKKRKVPGLRPQHLTGIKLLAKICNAKVNGLNVGSTTIKFIPKNLESYTIEENIGTAGSISLILQVLIPAVSISKKSLKLSIVGGTDVPWSPTSDYTKYVLREAYSRIGINFSMEIKKRGYYPRGGGIVKIEVFPSEQLKPILLTQRQTKSVKLLCSYSDLSSEKIKNEVQEAENLLKDANLSVESEIKNEIALNKGGSMLVFAYDSNSIVGSDGLTDTTKEFAKSISKNFIKCNLGADNHLSDMLVLPASLVNETSVYRIKKITKHLETNLYIASKITGCKYGIGKLDDGFELRVIGNSDAAIQ